MPILNRRDLILSGLALSATSAVSSNAFARTNALFAKMAEQAAATPSPRERLLFDFGWKFTFGNGNDPSKDLGFGMGQGDFSKTGDFEFATAKFDDSKWRSLNLPHDWAVELPFVWDEEQKSHGYKPLGRRYPETSVGWYRRAFDIPSSDSGRRIALEFDGGFRDALVFVNGCFIGRNDNGYVPFRFDITDFLHYGEKNYVVVRMDAAFGDGWFYEGAGLYRHVWLVKHDPLHLGPCESYIRAEIDGKTARLELGTIVKNVGAKAEDASVRWRILDPEGRQVATASATAQSVGSDGSATFTATARVTNASLWTLEEPRLYSAVVRMESGAVIRDAERVTFGIRTIRFDADEGFFLNGKPLKIKGTCNHQDHAGVGAALPDRLQYFRVAVLKEMGCNGVRTSHNMPTPERVDACDRLGMLMMCETRQMSSSPEGLEQLAVMIKHYRNSPSIILWSMGNEEWYLEKDPSGTAVMAEMVRRSHELDPTRLCTAAVNGNYYSGVSKSLDVEGVNYNLDAPDAYHQSHPRQPMIGTETASSLATRGIYRTDPMRNWMSAYDVNQPGWGETAEVWWKFYAARKWLAGGFAWTGFDYRGEPTPYGWPSISSQFGIVDTCGYPKDTFFYYKSWWGTEPVLHLFPHWNWEGEEGQPISVWVHSNLDSVELFLNGKSLGSRDVPRLTHIEWKVNYEPGVLEARGSKNGKVVMVEKRETTGKPAIIRLTADRANINADGEDIAVLRVEALDAQGRLVPTADDLVHFTVTGPGAVIGVGNGDPNSHESDKGTRRSLFNGLAQVIVQSTKTPGQITISAKCAARRAGIAPAMLTIEAKPAGERPFVA